MNIFTILSLSVAPYSIASSAQANRVWSLTLLLIFLCLGERENHLWVITSSSLYLMFRHVAQLNWLHFWTMALLRLLCISSFIYISPPPSFSSIFFVVDCQSELVTLRALPMPSCSSQDCHPSRVCQFYLVSHLCLYCFSFFFFSCSMKLFESLST